MRTVILSGLAFVLGPLLSFLLIVAGKAPQYRDREHLSLTLGIVLLSATVSGILSLICNRRVKGFWRAIATTTAGSEIALAVFLIGYVFAAEPTNAAFLIIIVPFLVFCTIPTIFGVSWAMRTLLRSRSKSSPGFTKL